ncbi:hypothetical protein GCM10027605_36960 [Micromonospora zhanjiangensis]
MRPVHVYANLSDEQYHLVVDALHRQWRVATRAVMILLSAGGMPASEIGALLHYDPATVRRWISRHDLEGLDGLPDRLRSGRPRLGSPGLGARIRTLLGTPKAWTTARIWRALGRPPLSLRTVYRRVREQARWCRPRLVAKSDPDRDGICAGIRAQIEALPAGAVVLAEDSPRPARPSACMLDAPRDPPPRPDPRHQPASHSARRGQPGYRSLAPSRVGQERVRGVLLFPRHPAGRLSRGPDRGGDLR